MIAAFERDVAADDPIVVFSEFRIRDEQPDISPAPEIHHLAHHRKHALPLAVRRRICRRQHAECVLAGRAGELQSGAGVDDPSRMHRCAHRRVTARAGDVEKAEPFHEERPLLAEEGREALIDLDFECVAFHLAEIGVDRGIERDGRRQAVLHADAEISARPRVVPPRRIGPRLITGEGPARNGLEQPARLKLVEDDRSVRLEHPFAVSHCRP